MHGLNKNVDLTFLSNREVIQVAIGKYQVIFAFDEEVNISVEGMFDYSEGATASRWLPGSSQAATSAIGLLGARIESVRAQEDGTLELVFSNGAHLVLRDVNSEYESYQSTRRGETIVV